MVDHYYHIYNRGNNKEKLFLRAEHYDYFIQKYFEIVAPSVSTFAYCLLPNHFHFLVRVDALNEKNPHLLPSHVFRRFFQQYSIWFNKNENRRGSLFTKYFRRVEVNDEEYLKRLILYIHKNPVKHGIERDFSKYYYSSYKDFHHNTKTSSIAKDEVLGWFNNDLNQFFDYHNIEEKRPDLRELFFDEK